MKREYIIYKLSESIKSTSHIEATSSDTNGSPKVR